MLVILNLICIFVIKFHSMKKKVKIDDLIILLESEKSLGAKTILLEGTIYSLIQTDPAKEQLITSDAEQMTSNKPSAFIEKSKVIQKIATELELSTKTGWTSGDLEDWSNHAKKMKSVINTSLPILKLM